MRIISGRLGGRILKTVEGEGYRPAMGKTREALFSCAELFGRSVSGYGLDFLFSEHVRRNGGLCGVVDAVAVRHEMCIDEQDGAYYRLMRSLGIQHKLELYAIIHELGKYPQFTALLSS